MMPTVDPDDVEGWFGEIRRMGEDETYSMRLSREIAAKHRPTPSATSWATIKRAMLDRAPIEAQPAPAT